MISPHLHDQDEVALPIEAWDVSAWIGAYPFRHLREQSLQHLCARANDNHVKHVIVCGYDHLFAQNGMEYWNQWTDLLAHQQEDHPEVEYWPVVNPAMPGEIRRLEKGLANWPCRGIRLLPSYHNYRAWDPALSQLMTMARERSLIVQIFVRIADERWHWMHQQPALDFTQDVAYITSMFEHNQLIICGASTGELQSLSSRMRCHPSLHADLSRVRGPAFVLDEIDQSLPVNRLLFGSLWPLQILEASLWEVTSSRLSHAHQQAILHGNAKRLIQNTRNISQPKMEPVS